jgi:hypothetical protein
VDKERIKRKPRDKERITRDVEGTVEKKDG